MPITPEIIDLLAKGTGFFVTLVRVTAKPAKGGDEVAYALHTRDIVFDGSTFKAVPFEPSKVQQNAGTQTSNATVTHLLGDLFTKINVKGGKWGGAKIELMAVDILNLAAGPARKHIGRVGDVTTGGQEATSDFRGLMQMLNQDIGDRTSRRCRYQLGDANCTLDLTTFRFVGTVAAITNNQKFTVSGFTTKPDGYFKYGRAKFTSGLNNGLEMEVINNTGQLMTLFLPMPGLIQIGDTVQMTAGDDKSLQTCFSKFNNAVNHGGEDSMPKREDVYKFPE